MGGWVDRYRDVCVFKEEVIGRDNSLGFIKQLMADAVEMEMEVQ